MKRVVALVQAVAVVGAVLFLVMLFANEPDSPEQVGSGSGNGASVDGAAVYSRSCARCHGAAGQGGIGPQLADGRAVQLFPDIEDQIAVITNGLGGMPAFGSQLSDDEIRAVAEYERSL